MLHFLGLIARVSRQAIPMTANTLFNKILQKFRGGGAEGTLLRGAGSVMLINPLSLALSFLINSILLPRVMSIDSLGIYTVAMGWLQIFIFISLLGQDTSLLRFIPQYVVKHQWGHLKGLITTCIKYSQGIGILIALALGMVLLFINPYPSPEKKLTFLVTLPLIPLLALTGIREAALRGLKRTFQAYIPDSIVRPLALSVLVLGTYLFIQKPVTAPLLMLLSTASILVAMFLGGYWLLRALPKETIVTPATYEKSLWFRVSLPLILISGMGIILKRCDLIMLDMLQGEAVAGYYGAAVRLSDLATFGLTAVNAVAVPMISELYNKGSHQELQKMIALAARGIFVITLLVTLVLIFAGKFLLGLSGANFVIAYTPLIILLAGQIINALCGSVGYLMTMTGHQNQAAYIIVSGTVLNIILNAILIPLFGMTGSAIATALTTALWNLAMLIYVIKKLKLNPTVIQ